MKIGDTFDVSLGGVKVTEARVTYMEDGIAELIFEGQRVKMSYVTQLAPDLTAPVDTPKVEPSKQVIIDGVDRRDAAGNVIASESAPVGETPNPPVDVASAAQTVEPVVESGPQALQEAPQAPPADEQKPVAPVEGQ